MSSDFFTDAEIQKHFAPVEDREGDAPGREGVDRHGRFSLDGELAGTRLPPEEKPPLRPEPKSEAEIDLDGLEVESRPEERLPKASALLAMLPEKNPDRVAELRKLSRDTGLPPEMMEGLEQEWRDHDEGQKLDELNLPETAPRVFDWMRRDFGNFQSAWDQAGSAKAVESLSRNLAIVYQNSAGGLFLRDLGAKLDVGEMTVDRGKLGSRLFQGDADVTDFDLAQMRRRSKEIGEISAAVMARRSNVFEAIPFVMAESVPFMLDIAPQGAVGAGAAIIASKVPGLRGLLSGGGNQLLKTPGVGRLIKRAVANKTTAQIAGGVGGALASWNATSVVEGGNLYLDLLDDFPELDKDDPVIRWITLVGGTASGGLEVAGDVLMLRTLKGVGGFVKPTEFVRGLAPSFMRRVARSPRLRRLLESVAGETFVEASQELPSLIGAEIVKTYYGAELKDGVEVTWGQALERVLTDPETWERIGGSALAGAQGGLGFGGLGTTLSLVTDSGRAQGSEQTEFVIDQIKKNVDDMQALRERDEETLKGALGAALEEGPIKEVRLDASDLRTQLQSEGTSPEEFFEHLGQEAAIRALEQYDKALTDGGDVVIAMADYAAGLMHTALHPVAVANMRLRPGDMTPTQRAVWKKEGAPEAIEQLAAEEREESEQISATEAFVTELSESINRQVSAVSRFNAETSRLQAQLSAHGLVTLAKRMNFSDDAVAEMVKLQVGRLDSGEIVIPQQRAQLQPPDSNFVDLLAEPGESQLVGPEAVVEDSGGIQVLDSSTPAPTGAEGSVSRRYVKRVDGVPVAVLQVNSTDGQNAVITQTFTHADQRRQGHARELLERARQDFERVDHSDDLSVDGRAFAEATLADGEVLAPQRAPQFQQDADPATALDFDNLSEQAQFITITKWMGRNEDGSINTDDLPEIQGTGKRGDVITDDLYRFLTQRVHDEFGGDLSEPTEENLDILSDVLAHETKAAFESAGENAAEWYRENLQNGLAAASAVFPELATDERARFAFTIIMAITSQEAAVAENVKNTFDIYEQYRVDKKFPSVRVGKGGENLVPFDNLNALIERFGFDDALHFLNSDFKVGELEAIGYSIGSELVSTVVPGSVIFGPKIGAFFQNLSGNFEPITFDRWWMKTMGRMMGNAIELDPKVKAAKLKGFEKAAREYPDKLKEITGRKALPKTKAQRAALADKVFGHFVNGKFKDKHPLTYAAKGFAESGKTIVDAGSGGNRAWMRRIVERAQEKLKAAGVEVDNAALQALMWYPEKDFTRGYEIGTSRADPTDFQQEITKLVAERDPGADTEGLIADAARRRAGSTAAISRPKFAERARRKFVAHNGLLGLRSELRANAVAEPESEKAGPYGVRAGGTAKGSRVLGPDVKAVKRTANTRTKNILAKIGLKAPEMLELEGDRSAALFLESITDAKGAIEHGAAVETKTEEEYKQLRLFVTPDLQAGFALAGDDIVSLFSTGTDSVKGSAVAMMVLGIQQGGRRLDAFDTVLPDIYSQLGFRVVSRLNWDDTQAPPGWDKATFEAWNGGEPDVVFMAYDPDHMEVYTGQSEGTLFEDFGEAAELQRVEVEKIAKRRSIEGLGAVAFQPDDAGQVGQTGQVPQIAQPVGAEVLIPKPGQVFFQPAFHGTPHRFDKFTLDHIGTGEGVQAFGWGLYFASRKQVAEYYREQLVADAGSRELDLFDITVPENTDFQLHGSLRVMANRMFRAQDLEGEIASDTLLENTITELKAHRDDMRRQFRDRHELQVRDPVTPSEIERAELLVSQAEALTPDDVSVRTPGPGQVAEVDIPESSELLDNDLALSEQPEGVKAKILAMLANSPLSEKTRAVVVTLPAEINGEMLYRMLANAHGGIDGAEKASITLREAGIPGLQYNEGQLSGGSRPDVVISGDVPAQHADALQRLLQAASRVKSKPTDPVDLLEIALLEQESNVFDTEKSHRKNGASDAAQDALQAEREVLDALRDLTPDQITLETPKNFVIWDEEAIGVLRAFFQPGDDGATGEGGGTGGRPGRGPRGLAQFPATFGLTPTTIALADHADKSTFLHETWHVLIEVLGQLAQRDDAPAQIVNDYNALLAHVGLEPGQPLVDPAEIDPALEEWAAAKASGDAVAIRAAEAKINHANRHAETLAREGERYLLQGRAPSAELRSAFAHYRRWLQHVYRNFQEFFGVAPSDEINDIFDRVLATDEQIEQAKATQKTGRLFREKPDDMTDAAWQSLRLAENARDDEAYETLAAEQSRADQRALDDLTEDRRADIRDEVEVQLRADPAHQLRQWLANGVWIGEGTGPDAESVPRGKLDADDVPDEWLERLPRGSNGVIAGPKAKKYDSFFLANIFLGQGGRKAVEVEEMYEMLSRTLPLAEAIEAETARRVEAEGVGAVTGEDSIGAIHNESGAKVTRLGLAQLRRMADRQTKLSPKPTGQETPEDGSGEPDQPGVTTGEDLDPAGAPPTGRGEEAETEGFAERRRERDQRQVIADQREMRRVARRDVQRTKIWRLSPEKHSAAERRAADKSRSLVLAERFAEAADWLLKEMYNHFAYREARKAQVEVDKHIRFLKRYDKRSVQQAIAKAGPSDQTPFWDQIELILHGLEIRQSQSTFEGVQSLAKFVDGLAEEDGRAFGFDPDQITSLLTRRHFRELTVEEFRSIREAVQNIEKAAKDDRKITVAGERQDLDDAVDTIVVEIEEAGEALPKKNEDSPGIGGKLVSGTRTVHAWLAKPESFIRSLAGFAPGSFIHDALFQRFRDAQFKERRMMEDITGRVSAAFDAWGSALEQATMGSSFNKVYVKEIDWHFTREELISIGLNSGNDENRIALRRGRENEFDGQTAWTEEQLDAVLSHLTREDWTLIQEIWDSLETMWPEISALLTRVDGLPPRKVEVRQVETKFGTFRGGYYPLKYDPKKSWIAQRRDAQADVNRLFGGGSLHITTKAGATNERIGSGGQAVKLGLDALFRHVDEVIHDLTHREAVMDALRIINHPKFRNAVTAVAGQEMYDMLRPWIQRIAGEQRDAMDPIAKILRRARVGATVTAMGFKATTGMMQFTAVFSGAATLGHRRMLKALLDFSQPHQFRKTWDFALEHSKELRDRVQSLDRDINDTVKRLTTSGLTRTADAAYFWHIGMMDMLVSVPTWMAGYTQGMEELFDGDERKSIAHADAMLVQSQASGAAKDLSSAQGGGETQKLFTMFFTYMNAQYSQVWEDLHNIKRGPNIASRLHAFGDLFMRLAVATLVGELLAGRGPDEDETVVHWGLTNVVVSGFGMIPVVREMVSAALTRYRFQMSPVEGALESPVKFIDQSLQGEFDEQWARSVVDMFGFAFQLPARQGWITGEFIWDYASGDADSEGYEVLRDLLFPRPKERR